MTSTLQPDPSAIGGVAHVIFARLPDPQAVFARRAARFSYLAQTGNLGPYLEFLAALTRVQDRLAGMLSAPPAPSAARVETARAARMPPLDRQALATDAAMARALQAVLVETENIVMPDAARDARDAVLGADEETRAWLLRNVLSDAIPPESPAPHIFAALAAQVAMAQAASLLDADRLVPVAVGICPACGGRPVGSSVVEMPGVEGLRYACCATCATEWNEVRVKCLCCGSTKGIGYRGLESAGAEPASGRKALAGEATVKAEVCDECHSWLKIFYANRNPSLDPVADDVASLGLDIRMRESEWRRAGVNPYLVGW